MKVLKGFFLVIIVIVMFIVLMALELQFVLQKTILEPSYFEKKYDANNMDEALEEIINEQLEILSSQSSIGEEGEIQIEIDPQEYVDTDWLIGLMKDLTTGTYEYFTGGTDKLPEIDLVHIKETILKLAVDQMMKQDGIAANLDQLDSLIDEYNAKAGEVPEGEVDNAAIESLAQEFQGMGLSADILETIIKTEKTLDENLSSQQKTEIIVAEIISDQMGLDEMEDVLDINDIVDKMYPDGENPLEAIKTIIFSFKNTLFSTLAIIFMLLMLIVIFTAFKPSSVFGWLSAPLIMGGLFGIGIWIVGRVLPVLGRFADTLSFDNAAGAESVRAFIGGYVNGIFNFALIQGLIILVIGIVFAILASVLLGYSNRSTINRRGQTGANSGIVFIRAIVVVVLLASIVFATSRYYLKIYNDISGAADTLKTAQSNTDFVDAIAETVNIPFLDFMGKGE